MRLANEGAALEIDRLRQMNIAPNSGIVQEHLDGPQFEISGVVGGRGQGYWFPPLLQTWDVNTITNYAEIPHDQSIEFFARSVVHRLQLQWCFVCIELRRDRAGGWRAIEVHCRPGDDDPAKGYPDHVTDGVRRLHRWYTR
jgi:hypothetical protein